MRVPTNPMAVPTIAVRDQASGRNEGSRYTGSVEMTRTCGTTAGSACSAPMNQTNKVIASHFPLESRQLLVNGRAQSSDAVALLTVSSNWSCCPRWLFLRLRLANLFVTSCPIISTAEGSLFGRDSSFRRCCLSFRSAERFSRKYSYTS